MASVSKRTWTYKGETKTAWVVRYKHGGQHRSKQFEKKKDAEKYRVRVDSERASGLHVAVSESITVQAAIDQYLADMEVRYSEKKIGYVHFQHTRHYLRKHVAPHIGDRLLINMKYGDVSDLRTKLIKVARLKTTTVAKLLNMLALVVELAMRRGQVAKNLVRTVIADNRGQNTAKVRTFTVEEVGRLFRAARVKNSTRQNKEHERARHFMECCIYIAACCGLRRGEILALTWENVNLEGRVIQVRHNLTNWGELKGPKTKSGYRDVAMPLVVASLLREWKSRYHIETKEGFVFRTRTGTAIASPNFNRRWHYLLAKAGLHEPDEKGRMFHFHALRHFMASMMIESNVPLTDVAEIMGHNRFDMTLQVYAHTVRRGRIRHDIADQIAVDPVAELTLAPLCVTQELRKAT
jgi:integrase